MAGESGDDAKEPNAKASDRGTEGETRPLDLSGGQARQAFAIHESSRQYLKDAELKRAVVFSQFEDADGNSSSTMRLDRPTAQELDQIFEDYMKTLSGEDRKFVEQTGLSTNLKKDIEDFFGYDNQFRYVTFLLAGDGSASLPSVLILESDKLYDGDQASQGKLEVPMSELRLKEFADLKVGSPELERYGRLFSVK
ncbi:hypothetical protein [Luteolibacter soli]|uniref:Uncharacterized protein n=1 Tax=Luteolibacter soli TaxID=3135280 RepID=A0ABU9AN27_9BACT